MLTERGLKQPDRDRQTDRQTDRQSGRQTDRQREGGLPPSRVLQTDAVLVVQIVLLLTALSRLVVVLVVVPRVFRPAALCLRDNSKLRKFSLTVN